MAIKKCDDIVSEAEGVVTEETEGTASATTAAAPDPADFDASADATQQALEGVMPNKGDGAAASSLNSETLADVGAEMIAQMTPESVAAALQDEELQALQDNYKDKENAYLGKTITAVESSIYDTITDPLLVVSAFGNGTIRSTRPATISDPLRAEYRSFYTLDSNKQLVFFNQDNVEMYGDTVIELGRFQDQAPYSVAGDLFKKYGQTLIVQSDKFIENSDEEGIVLLDPVWQVFANGGTDSATGFSRPSALIDTTTTFTDHYVKFNSLFNDEEMERFANPINNPAYGKVVPTYNFFVKGYENFIASSDIKEYQLQNQFSNITREKSRFQTALHKLGMDYRYVKKTNTLKNQQGYDITEKFQNIGIPKASVPSVKEITDTDDLYPLLNYIEFNTEAAGPFTISATDSGMTDDLFKHLMDQNIVYPEDLTSAAQANRLNFALSTELVTYNNDLTIINTDIVEQNVALVNLSDWLLSYFSDTESNNLDTRFSDVAVLLGVDPNKAEASEDCSAFLKILKSLVMSGKISQIVNDRFRTFEQMLAGKEAYNETVMYEILKTGGQTTQRIFIPNTEELDIVKYADTQVKYNHGYTYEIFAHQLIVGTSYSYNNPVVKSDFIVFGVDYEPSLQIARLSIFKQEAVKILDSAPVFPNVDIIPFKGQNNRILINLNGNMGRYELDPIIITDADNDFAKAYREARGLSSRDPIVYESDDPVNKFEIYRTTEPPKSYKDFKDKLLTTVSSDVATSVSFNDNVSPNTKYYYTFRSIDVHGNRSNPTDVYMIELVEYEGMIFFNQSIYQFGDIDYNNVKTTKTFKRYFQINPNFVQKMIDYEKTFPDGDRSSALKATSVAVGRADTSVWDKRFKLRITSKNSGKKFDLNFTCKTQFIQNTEEVPLIESDILESIAKTGQAMLDRTGVVNTFEINSSQNTPQTTEKVVRDRSTIYATLPPTQNSVNKKKTVTSSTMNKVIPVSVNKKKKAPSSTMNKVMPTKQSSVDKKKTVDASSLPPSAPGLGD